MTRAEAPCRGDRRAPSRAPTRCSSQPTRIAKARRSPGTSRRCCGGEARWKGVDVRRVTFNEITKQRRAGCAWQHPRDLDQELIDAYLARRALDYLVGFTLSPVLWRKLPGSRSAGRVQSVALRLICEREAEIEAFRAREYWTIEAEFPTPGGAPFTARLTQLDGKKLDQFDLADEKRRRCAAEGSASRPAQLHRRLGRAASASSAIRRRRSPPRPCSRKPRASSASARSGRCGWRSSCMKASISAARRSA